MLPALPLLLAKPLALLNFVLYRVAVWSGAAWLFRRGRRTGRWFYYAASVVVYAASWIVVIFFSKGVLAWISRWRKPG